jgi:hypothetical protein
MKMFMGVVRVNIETFGCLLSRSSPGVTQPNQRGANQAFHIKIPRMKGRLFAWMY